MSTTPQVRAARLFLTYGTALYNERLIDTSGLLLMQDYAAGLVAGLVEPGEEVRETIRTYNERLARISMLGIDALQALDELGVAE